MNICPTHTHTRVRAANSVGSLLFISNIQGTYADMPSREMLKCTKIYIKKHTVARNGHRATGVNQPNSEHDVIDIYYNSYVSSVAHAHHHDTGVSCSTLETRHRLCVCVCVRTIIPHTEWFSFFITCGNIERHMRMSFFFCYYFLIMCLLYVCERG